MTAKRRGFGPESDGSGDRRYIMDVPTTKQGNVTVLTVPWEKLDMSTTAEFKDAMNQAIADESSVVLEMGKVQFVDSSGLGTLLSLLRDLSGRGGDLKLSQVQKRVRAMFELVRMHRILSVYETTEEAVAAFETSDET
jgi:anti-sigma B factor antagonist